MRNSHVFLRLDEFEFDEFLRIALPALERLDAVGTVELLTDKLNRAVQASAPDEDAPYPGYTSLWCRHLDQADPIDGVVAQLARALAGVAARACITRETAERVFAILERHGDEIFQRIRLNVLAQVGQLTPARLDAFFRGRISIEPPFRAREVAAVVRQQFMNAPPDARAAFQHSLEAGPTDPPGAGADGEDEQQHRRRHWQTRRLLWFRDRIPEALLELATQAGVTGAMPSPEEEGLAEDGFFSSGGFVGERSPTSLDELAALTPGSFVEYLTSWRPDSLSWDSPTREGLQRILTEYAAARPGEAVERAHVLVGRMADIGRPAPGYFQALVGGVRSAVEAGTPVDWPATLHLLDVLTPTIELEIGREESRADSRPWRWLATEIVDLLIAASRKNSIPLAQADVVWTILEGIIASARTWVADEDGQDFKSFGDVLSAALNTAAGRATEALIEVALAVFRTSLAMPESSATPDQLAAAKLAASARLRPLLQHVMSQSGRGAKSAQAVMGSYLPQLHFLDRPWLVESASALFAYGTNDPLHHPAWGGYVTRATLYDDVFSDLREWYVVAVGDMPPVSEASTEGRDHWSVTQHIAEHVFGAYMRGLVEIGDADHLMQVVFDRLPAEERAHISWQVFRSWTDAKRPIPPAVVDRLVRFWRWRLEQIEGLSDSDSRTEDLKGLTWLICAPYVPDNDVLELGCRTVEASRGEAHARGAMWERLSQLGQVDIDRAFQIADRLVRTALSKPHPYVTLEQTERIFERALSSGGADTRERAERLIHTLGERGFTEFGRLLRTGT